MATRPASDFWTRLGTQLGRLRRLPRLLVKQVATALNVPLPGSGASGVVYDVYPSGGPWWNRWRSERPDTVDGSSIVRATVGWVGRTFPEAPLRVYDRTPGGDEVVFDHPLELLVEQPNPYYGGPLLWMATLADYFLDGNAYWLKVRDARGQVVELWWLPAAFVEPRWDAADDYITYYDYRPAAAVLRLEFDDVVHLRYGLDAENPRKGKSPFAYVLAEVLTDAEAALYTRSILTNLGVPGVILSPEHEQELTVDDAEAMKAKFAERFTGEHRGEPLVLTSKTKVDRLSFSPAEINLREVRKIPEERISAALGLPAIVAGLGAGLDRSTYSNMAEAREEAFESLVIPLQRAIASDVQAQLLPDFGGAAPGDRQSAPGRRQRCAFDTSNVRVLQEDQDKLVTRLAVAVNSGLMTPNEARAKLGLPPAPDDQGDLRLLRTSLAPIPEEAPEPAPVPAALVVPPGGAAGAPDAGGALPAPASDEALPGGALLAASEGVALRAHHALPGNVARWMNGTAVGAGRES